jgi:hypothetical protein
MRQPWKFFFFLCVSGAGGYVSLSVYGCIVGVFLFELTFVWLILYMIFKWCGSGSALS